MLAPRAAPNGSHSTLNTLAAYESVRAATEQLCASLETEDFVVQSMPDVSPTKWHLAHTTWFFEAFILKPHLSGYREFDPQFHFLFNSYYESHGPRHTRPQRGLLTRPTVETVFAYRAHVDHAMQRWLASAISPSIEQLVTLGLHHEQQHQELMLMDIKHVFFCHPIGPAYKDAPLSESPSSAAALDWISHPEGIIDIGLNTDAQHAEHFAYDNEGPRHRQYLRAFALANRPTTNEEWLEFIEDGGYQNPLLWLSDAWPIVQNDDWAAPLYWRQTEHGEWQEFTLAGWKPLALNRPVTHLSYYEADAYARWAGKRLPTEAEWEVIAQSQIDSGSPAIPGDFVENNGLHPAPLNEAHPAANHLFLFGGTWEWTASPYQPYPGYQAPEGALGEYNAKFMCNQMVLRGGCIATPQSHFRPSYRNFFYPPCRWQFSGLRLAADV